MSLRINNAKNFKGKSYVVSDELDNLLKDMAISGNTLTVTSSGTKIGDDTMTAKTIDLSGLTSIANNSLTKAGTTTSMITVTSNAFDATGLTTFIGTVTSNKIVTTDESGNLAYANTIVKSVGESSAALDTNIPTEAAIRTAIDAVKNAAISVDGTNGITVTASGTVNTISNTIKLVKKATAKAGFAATYQLVYNDNGSNIVLNSSDEIDIFKDQFLKEVVIGYCKPGDMVDGIPGEGKFVTTKPANDAAYHTYMKLTFNVSGANASASDTGVVKYIDVDGLFHDKTAGNYIDSTSLASNEIKVIVGNGIDAANTSAITVKIDSASEYVYTAKSTSAAALTVGADGVKVANIQAAIDNAINAEHAAVGSAISDLNANVESGVDAVITNVNAAITSTVTSVNAAITSNIADVNAKVNSAVENVNSAATALKGSVNDAISSTVTNIDAELTSTVANVNAEVASAVNTVSATVTAVNTSVAALKDSVNSAIDSNVKGLEAELTSTVTAVNVKVSAAVATVSATVDAVNTKVTALTSSVNDAIDSTVANVKAEISSAISDVDSKVDTVVSSVNVNVSAFESSVKTSVATIQTNITSAITDVNTNASAAILAVESAITSHTANAVQVLESSIAPVSGSNGNYSVTITAKHIIGVFGADGIQIYPEIKKGDSGSFVMTANYGSATADATWSVVYTKALADLTPTTWTDASYTNDTTAISYTTVNTVDMRTVQDISTVDAAYTAATNSVAFESAVKADAITASKASYTDATNSVKYTAATKAAKATAGTASYTNADDATDVTASTATKGVASDVDVTDASLGSLDYKA